MRLLICKKNKIYSVPILQNNIYYNTGSIFIKKFQMKGVLGFWGFGVLGEKVKGNSLQKNWVG